MLYNKKGLEIETETLEKCLEEFIEKMFEKHSLKTSFPNKLLREDVINLLDKFCIVVFYPLKDKDKNNGFHVKDVPFLNGTQKHFVFINTAQTMDKQNFTAAHELGHIWKVDEYVLNELDIEPTQNNKELIINRFAAVLLMPKTSFLDYLYEECGNLKIESEKIKFGTFIKLSVNIMNQFFTPFKSVVRRFFELDILSKKDLDLIFNEELEEAIKDLVDEYIQRSNYIKLTHINNKKWIEGLHELLDIAKKKDCVTQEKLEHLRNLFDLKSVPSEEPIKDVVSFSTQKGAEDSGN